MEHSIPKPVFPPYPGYAVPPSTPEESQLINSEFLTSQLQSSEQSGGSVLANALSAQPWFEQIQVGDLDGDDFDTLDRARRATFYVYTVEEFADSLKKGVYDIFKLRAMPGTECIILTSYEVYPRHKFLMIHYLAGDNCKPYIPTVKAALWELADRKNCDGILYMAHNPVYVSFIGGKQLSVLYAMER